MMREALVSALMERAESEIVERNNWRMLRMAWGRRGMVESVVVRGCRRGGGVRGWRRERREGRRTDVGVLDEEY